MTIEKAVWTTDDQRFSMCMSLSKVDKENRLVSGWATLDNVDTQNDVVLASASQVAFEKFRGNIREMHMPKAVGRMVDYRPDVYFDKDTGQAYNGIFVTTYVSKGAQDTWEKVLDGTLSAFSIQGPITDWEMDYSGPSPRRVIKGYSLNEISLVDSGGNQLANVVSFQKSSDGLIKATGMAVETEIQNVFWCDEDGIGRISTAESETCPKGHVMELAGWTEKDSRSNMEKVNSVLSEYLKRDETAEGGVINMSAENETAVTTEATEAISKAVPSEVTVDVEAVQVTESSVEAETPEVTKASGVAEEATPEPTESEKLAKSIEDLEEMLKKGLADNSERIEAAIKDLDDRFDSLAVEGAALSKRLTGLEERHDSLSKSLESLSGGLVKLNNSVVSLESDSAIKKSGDLGGSREPRGVESSGIWGGTFLND